MQNTLKLIYFDSRFVALCRFQDRDFVHKNGFLWCSEKKHWYTKSLRVAARLREFADDAAKKKLDEQLIVYSPWPGSVTPPRGCVPFHFQIEAAIFALSRNRSYLALDPGLGKTIIAALIAREVGPTWYVCPPFLVEDVRRKLDLWAGAKASQIEIIPDTMLEKIRLISGKKALLIVDEAHRFKNADAKRTKALFLKLFPLVRKVVFMSGTPIPNRPIELFTILSHAAPETISFMNLYEYGRRYCAGFRGPWGWDFSGASHVPELALSVKKNFMLRIRKREVLSQLPPKTENMVVLSNEMPAKIAELEKKILAENSPVDLMKQSIGDEHISTYRKLLGKAKCKVAAEFIKDLLDSTEEKVLVFAIHRDVIAQLAETFERFSPIVVDGSVAPKNRMALVDEFQTNPERRLFIGNIQAAGVGFTLTKATRVVFVEFSWVPAENEQASDRAHRIGQGQHVFCQYLVFKNSLDRRVLETVLRKRKIIEQV